MTTSTIQSSPDSFINTIIQLNEEPDSIIPDIMSGMINTVIQVNEEPDSIIPDIMSGMINTVIQVNEEQKFNKNVPKFDNGLNARQMWAKPIITENTITIQHFNTLCDNQFTKKSNIELDSSTSRQTTIYTTNFDTPVWKEKSEHIYALVRNELIMKLGGTRTGLKERWSSYLCGHCVQQRMTKRTGEAFPGKMSVTNAHLYHTIEKDLLDTDSTWELWSWKLPLVKIPVVILNEEVNVIAQTYHAFESICIKKFKDVTGHIPLLCNNSDPGY